MASGIASGIQDYETVFTNAKAGMEHVDKEYVKTVVFELSKSSSFFLNEKRKEALHVESNKRLQERIRTLQPKVLTQAEEHANNIISEIEAGHDFEQRFIHVDMDMFFAAVEQLKRPDLAHLPMAVGGMGMISTANYVARKYGVRSAMPGFIGKVLVERPAPGSDISPSELIFVKPDFDDYVEVSNQVKELLREYDENLVSWGLDEACLNVGGFCAATGRKSADVAAEIRSRIREGKWLLRGARYGPGLTASCGIASSRRLAKICSDLNKPDGQFELAPDRSAVREFVRTLPVRKVCGVGRVMERCLCEVLGVSTCGQLLEHRGLLVALFSQVPPSRRSRAPPHHAGTLWQKTSRFLLGVGVGAGDSGEGVGAGRRSVSVERTFAAEARPAPLEARVRDLAAQLAAALARAGLEAACLTLKTKTDAFRLASRQAPLAPPTACPAALAAAALRLLRAGGGARLRLLGLRASALRSPCAGPLHRFLAPHSNREPLHAAHAQLSHPSSPTSLRPQQSLLVRAVAGDGVVHNLEPQFGSDAQTMPHQDARDKTASSDLFDLRQSLVRSQGDSQPRNRLDALVDMGFDRADAVRALQNAGSLNAAVDRLVSQQKCSSNNSAGKKRKERESTLDVWLTSRSQNKPSFPT